MIGDDEYDYPEYHSDDDDGGFGFRPPHRRRGNDRDSYFLKLQLMVAEEENKSSGFTSEDEELLFKKVCFYIKKPITVLGILTLQKLAFMPSTVSADRLKEIVNIICKSILNPLPVCDDYIDGYVDFCKAFAFLKATTKEGFLITFEDMLILVFLEELSKKFGYSQRLKRLLDNRNISQEKKLKWLLKQIEEQERVFEMITNQSVKFLKRLFQLYPKIVYRVVEFLLKSDEEDGFQYLSALLETVKYHHISKEENDLTDIHRMKLIHWERNRHNAFNRMRGEPIPPQKESLDSLLTSILKLSITHYRITKPMMDVIQYQIVNGHPKRDNCPQDYIKYCLKDCLLYEKFSPLDDFKIDDDGDNMYDRNIYTIRSKDFTSYGLMHFWKGLKVKIFTKTKTITNQYQGRRGK